MRSAHLRERSGRDRWLLSYADLVTLLLACFTTAYAASLQSTATAASAPAGAAVTTPAPIVPAVVLPEGPREPAAPAPPAPLKDLIAPIVAAAIGADQIEIIEDERGLVVTLPESATFPSGSAQLTREAQVFLSRLGDALRPTGARIRVEGHTDDVPVSGRFASNWELSTARASAVVVYLVQAASFEPARLSAAGYGEFHPRTANDSPEQRALNRRVDVVVTRADERPAAGARDTALANVVEGIVPMAPRLTESGEVHQ